ncbi:valine--tRNA ligase [Rhizorhapis suberifaciens]|uniref:Valine--tRNA ligase n=1 Tax=Rhizorhapis suberifaciens TaxID=13656 RepID=A0A840HX27_9SPHN|nr:valine--tRNA ligase [Rhizorhapis suberifaciens]MBB4642016.1 valyl-tRNA synthetase [Rhizorhapis suberifaciens]
MTNELPKTFDPAAMEARWYAHWESNGLFRPERPHAQPFTIVNPPPNVTGSLHVGHALDNTLQDIVIRYERLRGKDALWVVGTDHAGIATQMVVERQMAQQQQKRTDFTREEFVAKVWEWKEESGGQITGQLRRLGASMDWANERFTMDEGFSKAVTKVFVDLYNRGLLYRDKRLVNWDPRFKTAISDLEVETKEVQGKFWHFKYPLEDGSGHISVATTRPETMLADMAVAVNPEDERYKALIGKRVRLPITGRLVPIVGDEHADPELGSGAVKITPGHDFNDFEVGKRAGIKAADMLNMLDADAKVIQTSDGLIPGELLSLGRFEARTMVVAMIEQAGLLEQIEDRVIQTPFGDRSGVVIEPWLTDQWYVDAETLAKPAIEAVKTGKIEIIPKTWEKTYFNWMENIQPWCVSRQLWWGHQIPAWYDADGDVYVAEHQGEAQAQAGNKSLSRDPDVLDTWFSSALWPFGTLGWPDATQKPLPFRGGVGVGPVSHDGTAQMTAPTPGSSPEGEGGLLQRHYPNDLLISGFDILFFWDARMIMQGIEFMKEVPFRRLYLHGLVRAADGQKMSKSKGNVVDPLGLIDQYGADALRFFMAAMESQGRDVKMDENRVQGYRNFATKLWNAARFCQANGIGASGTLRAPDAALPVNRWIIAETVATVQALDLAMAELRFDAAANAIYHFVWDRFCDWYLELIKGQMDDETKAVAGWVLDQILVMLHPFMPFVTEELWHALGERDNEIIIAHWPQPDAHALDRSASEEIDWLIRLVSGIRTARAELNVPPGARMAVHVRDASAVTVERLERQASVLARLARVEKLSFDPAAEGGAAQVVVDEATYVLPLEGVIDLGAERTRLVKGLEAAVKERDALAKRLENPAFVERAKPEAVAKAREDFADKSAEAERLQAALQRLG